MRQCTFTKADGGISCGACGRFVRGDLPVTTVAACGMRHKPKLIAVGDLTAKALSAVGITKERVSAVMGKKCNCASRQAKMNQIGYIAQYRALKAVDAAYKFVVGE
jgi:uncharacterized protein (UPF0218 family)